MEKYSLFVGIDVSKSTLDVCFLETPNQKQQIHFKVGNDTKGITDIMNALKKQNTDINKVLFCFEI